MYIRNFLTLLRRYTTSSVLNIVGMAVAFAAVYLIAVQVTFDLSYNRVIKNSERIYRLEYPSQAGDGRWDPYWNRQIPDMLASVCPEVEAAGSLHIDVWASQRDCSLKRNAAIENITLDIATAEPDGLKVFPFEFIDGGIEEFQVGNALVLCESVAKRHNLAVGDKIYYGRGAKREDAYRTLAGIYRDFPKPSSVAYVDGWYCLDAQEFCSENQWNDPYYIRLQEGASVEKVESMMLECVKEYLRTAGFTEEEIAIEIKSSTPRLNTIDNLYFAEDVEPEKYHGSRITTYTLIAIAVLILVISFINFVNFFFALIPSRIRVVNNFKIFGAPTWKLRLNILVETVGLILIALFGAIAIVVIFADTWLANYISTSVAIADNWGLAGIITATVLIAGIVVSLYPAWYITKFSPAFVIKGDFSASRSGRILRYTLVGIQFTISIVMIICSLFVYRQHQYMLLRDMGFDKENLLVVDVPSDAVYPTSYSWANPGIDYTRRNTFMDAIKHNPQIKDIAFGGSTLVANDYFGSITEDLGDGREITYSTYYVSYNFLDVMGIDMVDGRSFLPSDEENHAGAYIFNETAAKGFELTAESSIKGHIRGTKAPVVGICKDFNFQSAHFDITPYAFLVRGKLIYNLPLHAYIRTVAGADIAEVREYIFDTIMEFAPDADPAKVDVRFFSDELEFVYQREDKLSTLIAMFSFLSIVISIIGVFGLVLFETQYRRREIGIRRVHGASVGGILKMFNRKYLYIVALCSAVAIPVSYYIISRWMEQYVYRVEMSWWVYALAVGVILLITIVTVSLRSWSAANENPTNSIMH